MRSVAGWKFVLTEIGAKCVVTSIGMTLMLPLSAGSLDSPHIVSCSCKSFTVRKACSFIYEVLQQL